MAREIVQKDAAVLRAIAQEIPKEDIGSSSVRALVKDMKALLAKEKYGVALAAPQVGESVRLFIVAGSALAKRSKAMKNGKEEDAEDMGTIPAEDQVYINPKLSKLSRTKKEKHEGCLSVRGKWGMVARAEKASVRALDENGKAFTRGASGLLAHIFQHEMDHLNGILYTDKAKELYDDTDEPSDV
ncbi:peptide deformylase [Candidatus Kaiserbacteria bacterium RIFCSPHIGHO2_01_FULL_56_24]|uniref:Peptide deformylase n=1 Tax=Candidatus Kaiserbacteria bacterium RIFCSPHIGHO2_01_FULL_56_24 TaxID=1798487 RepID=A0A1F6DGY5_9BACT|nr:MAG: peptide deformylase [Candidatus Kaiserbacteria bacterium RIFCSPHIGHO2_01_FULL_56_24]